MKLVNAFIDLFSIEGMVLIALIVAIFAYIRFLQSTRNAAIEKMSAFPIDHGLSNTELERYARPPILFANGTRIAIRLVPRFEHGVVPFGRTELAMTCLVFWRVLIA